MCLAVLLWEVIRQNMPVTEWPWKLGILGIGPAATLSGLFASLLLAREQFARSMRPQLAWSSQFSQSDMLDCETWTATLMNVGPSIANVESVKYSIWFEHGLEKVGVKSVPREQAIEFLERYKFFEGSDYYLRLVTAGAPLPVVKQPSEGIEFGAFSYRLLESCIRLDLHVTVVDIMGDTYSKSLPFLSTLPANWQEQHLP